MEAHERAHNWELETCGEDDESTLPRRGQRVVHVEDDDDLRSLCAEILDEAGFDVRGCPTLRAGQAAIRERVPDVLLIDRDLPDGCGLDLVRWVRANPAYAGVQIIAFSARKDREDAERAIAAGCDAFIGKPCMPSMLVEAVSGFVRPDPDVGRRHTGRRRKHAPAA